jgi:hypothetical protein
MKVLNPYRCESCKFYFRNFCDSEKEVWNKCNIGSCQIDLNRGILIDRVGCASHSDLQSERDKVIQELWDWVEGDDNELDRPAKYKGDYVHASGRLRKKLLELRQQAGEPL